MPENISPLAIKLALLPPLNRLFGPVSEKRILRLLLIFGLLHLSGSGLFSFCRAEFWQVFGLGLLVPGGGFFAQIDFNSANGFWPSFAFLLSLASFGVSLGIWFGTGNIFAPPTLWLALAIVSASLHSGLVNTEAIGSIYAFVGLVFLAGIIFFGYVFPAPLSKGV